MEGDRGSSQGGDYPGRGGEGRPPRRCRPRGVGGSRGSDGGGPCGRQRDHLPQPVRGDQHSGNGRQGYLPPTTCGGVPRLGRPAGVAVRGGRGDGGRHGRHRTRWGGEAPPAGSPRWVKPPPHGGRGSTGHRGGGGDAHRGLGWGEGGGWAPQQRRRWKGGRGRGRHVRGGERGGVWGPHGEKWGVTLGESAERPRERGKTGGRRGWGVERGRERKATEGRGGGAEGGGEKGGRPKAGRGMAGGDGTAPSSSSCPAQVLHCWYMYCQKHVLCSDKNCAVFNSRMFLHLT